MDRGSRKSDRAKGATLDSAEGSARAWRDEEVQRRGPGRGYVRTRDLPRLIPILEADLTAGDLESHRRLLDLLRRALRQERARGLAADWSYDLARHAALIGAYHVEAGLHGKFTSPGDRAP